MLFHLCWNLSALLLRPFPNLTDLAPLETEISEVGEAADMAEEVDMAEGVTGHPLVPRAYMHIWCIWLLMIDGSDIFFKSFRFAQCPL